MRHTHSVTVNDPTLGTTKLGPMPQWEAERLARQASRRGCQVEMTDDQAVLDARFPVGTSVRHTTVGAEGVVTRGGFPGLGGEPAATFLDDQGRPLVHLTGRLSGWFVATHITPA